MTDDEALELLAARYRHPSRRRPHGSAYSRAALLEDLELINRSLKAHHATVEDLDDPAGMDVNELWVTVTDSAQRLIVLLRYG